jgi:hypothetical protein
MGSVNIDNIHLEQKNLATPSVPNYKSFWVFNRFIDIIMHLYRVYL